MVEARYRERRAGWRGRTAIYLILGTSMVLGGCSYTPDWANPVEWYRGTRDWIAGDKSDKQKQPAQAAKPVPGGDKAFPKLSSVPDRPAAPSEAERKAMASSLAADRNAARYTDQQIRLQSESVTRPDAARPAQQVTTVQPDSPRAPQVAAVPSVPVASSSIPAAPPPPAAIPNPTGPGGDVSPVSRPPQPMPAQTMPAQSMPALQPPAPSPRFQEGQFVNAERFSTRFPAGFGNRQEPVTSNSSVQVAASGAPAATIYFASGSSRVAADSMGEIRRVAQILKRSGGRAVVVGHASSRTKNLDPLRHQMANFRISYDRAQAVARALTRQGVSSGAIEVSAVSDSQPVFFEVMPAGEAGNRRVEIILTN